MKDGDTAELTFTITVKADLKPSFGDAVDDKTWIKDEQIAAFTLPAASGGDGTLSYALSPSLPDGITRDAATRHCLTGTPTMALSETTYTWTATDEDGDTATLTFTITVDVQQVLPRNVDLTPSFTDTVAAQSYVQDQTIDPLTFAIGDRWRWGR